MRRQLLTQAEFNAGYTDSVAPLMAPPNTWGAGSCNMFLLGEGVTRPFGGLTSQGAGSGMNYACQFGSDWGGLQPYSTVLGIGSQLLSYSNTMFVIGAGKASKLGAKLQSGTSTFTFTSASVNTGTGTINIAGHGLASGDPVYLTTSGTLPLGLTANTAYFVIVVDANNFKLASSYANSQAPTPITGGTTGTGTQTLHYGADIIATSVLQVASDLNAGYIYTYLDNAGLNQAETPVVIVPTSPSAQYTGQINGAVNFKIAAIRDRQNVGVNIDSYNAPVKGRASGASAVVVPNNKTVKITFPAAQAGQTHWAVFSTQEGFGGTGEFYRLGWRNSSDSAATWYFGIAETTVAAITDRTLEFDYRTGDLLPESAWLEDFPPQAGTHCVQIENIMIVFGTYDGTVAQVSLPGFFESYNPFHLLYFPEPVTAVLHRRVDDFAIVACRNSIHAIQYVGYRGSDLPSATITTITPDIGIAYQSNWALGGGNIACFIEGTGIVMMTSEGEIDFEFGKQVNVFTRNWDAQYVSVGFDPNTRTFIFSHLTEVVTFCLETGVWSSPVHLVDSGYTGNSVSAINSNGHLYLTLNNSGTYTAYKWDSGAARTPVCAISQWQSAPLGRSVNVYEMGIAIGQGNNTEPMVVGIHTNLFKTYLRGVGTTNGSATISGSFTTAYTGKQIAIFGANVGGAGVNYLIAKLTYASPTTATLTNVSTGLAVTASATLSNLFALVGQDFFTATPTANVEQFAYNFRPSQQNVRSWCVSTWMATDAITGNIYGQSVYGTSSDSSVVNI